DEFDRIVGIDRLKVIHVNDSKNPQGAAKDRHQNIGFGEIGFEALNHVVHHPKLTHLPKILETPFVGEDKKNKKAPYAHEIYMLKQKTFNEDLLEDIMNKTAIKKKIIKTKIIKNCSVQEKINKKEITKINKIQTYVSPLYYLILNSFFTC